MYCTILDRYKSMFGNFRINDSNVILIHLDTTKTGACQKTCELELIDYLLCDGTE